MIEASNLSLSRLRVDLRRHLHDFWGQHRSMCTHSIDDLLPHAPFHCAATGEMVKGSSQNACGRKLRGNEKLLIDLEGPYLSNKTKIIHQLNCICQNQMFKKIAISHSFFLSFFLSVFLG